MSADRETASRIIRKAAEDIYGGDDAYDTDDQWLFALLVATAGEYIAASEGDPDAAAWGALQGLAEHVDMASGGDGSRYAVTEHARVTAAG